MGDTVEILHRKIEMMTGIPMPEQRLIYMGKQLQLDHSLHSSGIRNDACLHLVARLRSTDHPRAWRLISDMVHLICTLSRNDSPFFDSRIIKVKLEQFMALPLDKQTGFENSHFKTDYYKIFLDARAPQALVMLYRSPHKRNQDCADECIRCFVSFVKDLGGTVTETAYCAKMVLEFCSLLKMYAPFDDVLYAHCRSALGMMLDKVEMVSRPKEYSWMANGEITFISVQDLFPYLNELGQRLLKDLMLSAETSTGSGPSLRDVCDFSAFLQPVLSFIGRELSVIQASCNFEWQGNANLLGDEAACLFHLFDEMLTLIDKCLGKVGDYLALKRKKHDEVYQNGWSHYLAILKDLGSIALLYPDSEDRFWTMLRKHKVVVRALVVLCASRVNDHSWLLKEKDVLDFESRRHLAMLMFPEVREDYEELHEMLIDRSQLLAESFEYISSAEPSSLHAGLFMEFKNEEATGPGVLREWFCMVCQAIFDPQNALFVACPLDRRRFYPNPASKVDPLHIRYFRFAGRVIALALMHKIQVGVVLDRVFFLQLAGRCVSVEDIKNADPCLYNSCKQILEMDPEFVDSDGLGLTFVTEVEELGSRKVVELCCGGKSIVLNSKNRKEYVYLIVQQHFVTSISEQVSSFAQGFADILSDGNLRTTFFASLELEELDWMLHGSESEEISVEDWKAHTEYNGYKKADPQIVWFWEVVGQLNVEQKKTLLFFWTSVKYLPVEGFRGLASKLFIYKSLESQDRLPSSHTCFYRLCIPPYPTKAIMQDRLQVITQEHIGCSFGTW
ncbi:E3 ubiquitin-protein ligase UPL5-like isoform X2 [Silene latifolia]